MNESKTNEQTWLSAISSTSQFILGFLLGVTMIAGSAVGAAYYYFRQVSSNAPEKPVYTEESQTAEAPNNQITEAGENESQSDIESTSNIESTSDLEAELELEPLPEEEEEEENIPPGAYYANVTWPQGLSLRAEPDTNSARIGGVGYDARILILEESTDKRWQKIRIPWSKQEGWVKAGNIKKASD
ncbi:conserved hypothetical protein [Hyella patelloides LEGE 07179]|uniref:SH3b domain-containing protein n=2 Tax=Hyella TaxID=945733 RepID=A0A563VQV6_9CYAN|nr:conserved hypothetical protein [Hyella patelloides LEGE 07179]